MTPDSNTSDSVNNRPRTRSKNAETHPGTAAQEALRVNAPRRDPAVIQQEKEAVKERKASKDKEKKANQARNEATKSIADEFRAQQVTKQAIDEAEMPRKTAMTSKGKSQYWTFLSLIYILDTKKKRGITLSLAIRRRIPVNLNPWVSQTPEPLVKSVKASLKRVTVLILQPMMKSRPHRRRRKKQRLATTPSQSSLPNHLAQPPTRKGTTVLLRKQKG
jgi:hypothetical protein